MAYIDDFRALASIAINDNISLDLRNKAIVVMDKIVDIMDKAADAEGIQIDGFLKTLNSKIEVIKQ